MRSKHQYCLIFILTDMAGKRDKDRRLSKRSLFGTQAFINIHRQKRFSLSQRNIETVESRGQSGGSNTYSVSNSDTNDDQIIKSVCKMKPLSIKSLFSFVSEANKYICLVCPENGKLICGPEPNLRKHIFHVHKKPEYLYDSQKKKNYLRSIPRKTEQR
nr:uncharacterized protein LOC124806801 [Hydra vulgaris]